MLLVLCIAVLVLVIICQYLNFNKSKTSLTDIDDLLKKLLERSDWKGNWEILDRLVVPHLDDIQRFSNAALVTGIGGTMGIFFLEALYLIPSDVSNLDITIIVQGAIPALLSSLCGIFFHLFILSKHLSEAQESVTDVEMRWLESENVPLRDGPIVNVDISGAVEKIFQEISATQKGVSDSTQEISRLLQENKEISLIQRSSAKEIKEGVQIFAEHLKSLPDDLRKSLDLTEIQRLLKEQQSDVLAILSDVKGATSQIVNAQDQFTDVGTELLESIKQNLINHQTSTQKICDNVQTLTETIETLPGDIRSSLEISEFFDKAARSHLDELYKAFKDHQSELKRAIIDNQEQQKRWLANNIHKVVADVIDDLQKQINETIKDPLDTMSKKLSAATKEMPDAANKFGTDLIESANTLATIPKELEKVSEGVNEVVRATADAALKPLSDEMKDFVGTIQDTHQRLEKTIHGLVHLIENLIRGMEIRSK